MQSSMTLGTIAALFSAMLLLSFTPSISLLTVTASVMLIVGILVVASA